MGCFRHFVPKLLLHQENTRLGTKMLPCHQRKSLNYAFLFIDIAGFVWGTWSRFCQTLQGPFGMVTQGAEPQEMHLGICSQTLATARHCVFVKSGCYPNQLWLSGYFCGAQPFPLPHVPRSVELHGSPSLPKFLRGYPGTIF